MRRAACASRRAEAHNCPFLDVIVGRIPSHGEHGLVHDACLRRKRRVAYGCPTYVHTFGVRVEPRFEHGRVQVRCRPAKLLGAALEAHDDTAAKEMRADRNDDPLQLHRKLSLSHRCVRRVSPFLGLFVRSGVSRRSVGNWAKVGGRLTNVLSKSSPLDLESRGYIL